MSTVKFNTWQNTDGTENYKCRAWVYFTTSGGTPSIAGSGNISSITDNGVGNYSFNFTTALEDTNYATAGYGNAGGANYQIMGGSQGGGTLNSTTNFKTSFGFVSSTGGALTNQDPAFGSVIVFR